jgi:hypothetical protein
MLIQINKLPIIQLSKMTKLLTIDSGIHTGLSYWSGTKKPEVKEVKTIDELCLFVLLKDIENVYMEGVDFRSKKTANSIINLAYRIGQYAQIFNNLSANVYVFPARAWKGNLNKHQTANRVYQYNNVRYLGKNGALNDHITDSVGMGVALQGKL